MNDIKLIKSQVYVAIFQFSCYTSLVLQQINPIITKHNHHFSQRKAWSHLFVTLSPIMVSSPLPRTANLASLPDPSSFLAAPILLPYFPLFSLVFLFFFFLFSPYLLNHPILGHGCSTFQYSTPYTSIINKTYVIRSIYIQSHLKNPFPIMLGAHMPHCEACESHASLLMAFWTIFTPWPFFSSQLI